MNIVFFGSGAFACSIAQHVHDQFALAGLTATTPKPRGRGRKVVLPKIITWAQSNGIPVFTPGDPNRPTFIDEIKKIQPDLFLLSSYGHILNSTLLSIPRFGGINIHPSLLPRYRGAAPIQRALMAGETTTGVSVIFMDEKVDHGHIIFQKKLAIDHDDTYGTLMNRLRAMTIEHINTLISDVEHGACERSPQDHTQKSYAPKVTKEETMINWANNTEEIRNLIRALSPHPAARTMFRGDEIKILKAHKGSHSCKPGTICFESKRIAVGTKDGSLILDEVKPANKSLMSGNDFMNGYRVKKGEVMA